MSVRIESLSLITLRRVETDYLTLIASEVGCLSLSLFLRFPVPFKSVLPCPAGTESWTVLLLVTHTALPFSERTKGEHSFNFILSHVDYISTSNISILLCFTLLSPSLL